MNGPNAPYVFLGPSLSLAEAQRTFPDAVYLPPAALGDVYALVERQATTTIGLIDGRFESTPAVWHKEILYALSKGVVVLGAASMGALRAAELHTLGMQGIGEIFRAYRDGLFEDDDEVAVRHGPAEVGYACLSVSMATIRYAIAEASAASLLNEKIGTWVITQMKRRHYSERTWGAVASALLAAGIAATDALLAFLSHPDRDRKRLDTLALLEAIKRPVPTESPPCFEPSAVWWDFVQNRKSMVATDKDGLPAGHVMIGHWRLHAGEPLPPWHEAWIEVLEAQLAKLLAIDVSDAAVHDAVNSIRHDLDLLKPEQVRAWLSAHALDKHDLFEWGRSEMWRMHLQMLFESDLIAALVRILKRRGMFSAFQNLLSLLHAKYSAADLDPHSLAVNEQRSIWEFYEKTLKSAVRGPLAGHARRKGFATTEEFIRCVLLGYRLAGLAAAEGNEHEQIRK